MIHERSSRVAYQGLGLAEYLATLSAEQRRNAWQKLLTNNAVYAWIAQDQQQSLGWIVLGASRDADAVSTTAELWAIYVDPAYWRQGIGRSLWQVAKERCIDLPFSEITLWLFKENYRALRFYTALGFAADTGHEKSLVRGDIELAEIRLRRRLSDYDRIS